MNIPRRNENCKICGLAEQPHLWGKCEVGEAPKVMILGSDPDMESIESGKPFSNGAGRVLRHAIKEAGFNDKIIFFSYRLPCVKVDNLSSPETSDAFNYCSEALAQEIIKLYDMGLRAIVAIGEVAQKFFGIEGSIMDQRGSVFIVYFEGRRILIVPTVTPEFIMRGNWHQELNMICDIQKAFRIAKEGWEPLQENFELFPTIEYLENKLNELRKYPDTLLAVDCEGWLGTFNRLWMVGFATSETDAFCIPFKKQGGKPYWNSIEELQRATDVLRALLAEFPTMYQNAQFDVALLWNLGFPAKRITHDTMLAHHVFHPELPHDLGYIASIYADTPYWKDIVLASEQAFNQHDDIVFRSYNLRDCVVLHQIMPRLQADLEQAGLMNVYRNIAVKLVHPTVQMQLNGMKLLKDRIPEWQKKVDDGINNANSNLRGFLQAPESFSPSSPYHVRFVLFGEVPESYQKAKDELASYEVPGSRKKKTTQAYKNLLKQIETIEAIHPMCRVKGGIKTTDKGKAATDRQALIKMRIAALKEIEDIGFYRRPTPQHAERAEQLHRLVLTIDYMVDYSKWNKLKTTYYEFKAGDDGRIHPSYPIHRTRTGRLASKGPNWQNLPDDVTILFGPDKGNVFIKPDWSNIEMRVLSFESDDDVLQTTFAEGRKVHDENVKILFGLDKDHPLFDTYKRAAKTYIFGRGYGGSLYGIFERVSMQVPEAKLTYEKMKAADDAYRAAHPMYVEWSEKTTHQVTETRSIVNAFGRRRIFLGDEGNIKREALNTPIQGTAADIANMCLIELQEWIDTNRTTAKIVLQQHDAIMIECSEKEAERIKDKMESVMQQKFFLWGRTVSFPVETAISDSSWQEMNTWEDYCERRTTRIAGKDSRTEFSARETNWNPEWGDDDNDDGADHPISERSET